MLIASSTVEICIQLLGRVEEIVLIAIVTPAIYPRFLEFLYVDIQSTGEH